MTGAELIVVAGGIVSIAGLAWFFFGPRTASRATVRGGRQEVPITVKGGYSPNLIRVAQGVPVRLVFDRQDNSGCTERVVFPDFGISRTLPAFAKTAIEFTPTETGEFGWACGMNMLHGRLVVEAGVGQAAAEAPTGGDGEVAAAVGVGPRREVPSPDTAHFLLGGSLASLPTRVTDIERQIDELRGVDTVTVNQGPGRVTVRFDAERVTVE